MWGRPRPTARHSCSLVSNPAGYSIGPVTPGRSASPILGERQDVVDVRGVDHRRPGQGRQTAADDVAVRLEEIQGRDRQVALGYGWASTANAIFPSLMAFAASRLRSNVATLALLPATPIASSATSATGAPIVTIQSIDGSCWSLATIDAFTDASSVPLTCIFSLLRPSPTPLQRASSAVEPSWWITHRACVPPSVAIRLPSAWPAMYSSEPKYIMAPIFCQSSMPESNITTGTPAVLADLTTAVRADGPAAVMAIPSTFESIAFWTRVACFVKSGSLDLQRDPEARGCGVGAGADDVPVGVTGGLVRDHRHRDRDRGGRRPPAPALAAGDAVVELHAPMAKAKTMPDTTSRTRVERWITASPPQILRPAESGYARFGCQHGVVARRRSVGCATYADDSPWLFLMALLEHQSSPDPDPSLLAGRQLHRVAHGLDGKSVGKARFPGPAGPVAHQVDRLAHERLAVPDALADRPAKRRVRVTRVLRPDATHPIEPGVVVGVAVEQLVQARILEDEGASRPVHLDGEVAGSADRHPGHLDGASRAALEPDQRRGGVVDGDRPVAVRCRPALDERLRLGGDLFDRSHHPEGHVDEMAPEVRDRGAAHRPLEPPVERRRGIGELIGQPDRPP